MKMEQYTKQNILSKDYVKYVDDMIDARKINYVKICVWYKKKKTTHNYYVIINKKKTCLKKKTEEKTHIQKESGKPFKI